MKGPRDDAGSATGNREERRAGYQGNRDDRRSGYQGSRDDSSRGGSGDRGPRGDRGGYQGTRDDRGPRRDDDRTGSRPVGDRRDDRPARTSSERPASARPAADRPSASGPTSDRPSYDGSDRPRSDRPASDRPRADRTGSDRTGSDRPASDRPYRERRDDGPRRDSADRRPARSGDRPDRGSSAGRPYAERTGRSDRPSGDRRTDRPSGDRRSDDRRPASGGYRERAGVPESARASFVAEPALSDEFTVAALDPEVRRDLRGLQKDTADSVARHLVAAGTLVEEDPQLALEHARYARRRASRIAVVREAAGITAYHAGEWTEALAELRAARRMGGGPVHLPVMADIERALGRPERAIDIARGPEASELGTAERIELAIVAAGARRDLGELDAAVVGLQGPELEPTRREPWSPRLFYAYADNLLAAGRESDALQWFVHAADADAEGETDAMARIAELTGQDPDDADDFAFGVDDGDAGVEAAAQVAGDPADDEPVVARVEEAADGAAPEAVAVDESVDDEPAGDGEPVTVTDEVAVETPVDDEAVDDEAVDDEPVDDVIMDDVPDEDVVVDDVLADVPDEEPVEEAVSEEAVSEEALPEEAASDEAPAEVVAVDEPAEQEPVEQEPADDVTADEVPAANVAEPVTPPSAVEEEQVGTDGGTSR